MKLLDLSIKNYRSIEDLILTFPTYYAAICGKNDSGKSNVLRALRSIFPIVGPSYFYREETISFKEDLPKWFGKDSKDKTINIRLRLSVDPESDAGLHGFLTTYLKLSEDKASLELIVGVTHSSETAEGEMSLQIEGEPVTGLDTENIIQKLQSSSIVLFHNSTDTRTPFFIDGKRQLLSEFSVGENEKLDEAKAKLNNTVNRMAKRYQEKVGELLGRLKERYTVGLSFPKIDPSEIPLSVTLGDTSMSVPLENWGSGTQNRTQILMTLLRARQISGAKESASKITPIIVVEEPEAFLHPSAQAEVGRILQEVSEEFRVQVIVTTHSPYLLSQTAPSSNLLLERRVERQRMRGTECVDTSGDKWMEPFGLALGIDNEQFVPWKDVIFSKHNKLLLVEGETDKEYFELLRDSRHGSKALKFDGEILSYGGKEAIKQRFLLNFIRDRYKSCFITFDLDVYEEVQPSLRDVGFEEGKQYAAIGLDEPGKKAIEGLVPESIRAAVYSAHAGLVDQAMNGSGKEKTSARSSLKKAILGHFKQSAVPGDEHYSRLYSVAKLIDRAMLQ